MIEYDNDNLMTKVLLDNGVTGSGTYAATDEQSVDLALADICLVLMSYPDIAEGKWRTKYSADDLDSLRRKIYMKWGLAIPEQSATPVITGEPMTINSETYPLW